MRPALLVLLSAVPAIHARLHHALAEDLYAFPKYRVTFLNGLPVLNETAERWLKDGLKGGELEFMDQPWRETPDHPRAARKEIGSSDGSGDATEVGRPAATLKHMRLSPQNSYLCLIPPPLEDRTPREEEDIPAVPTPAQSLSLLQPLSGSCLYHRQQWFTYSYCHNHQVRQFRELIHSHPYPAGGYVPEEDPEWEAYTLGRAPNVPTDERDLTVAQQAALSASVEVATGAGNRYLVQRWSDGTICDKDGRPREIEVQFHCSLTMTDTILFVKEVRTCRYVMVVHTPRLCGEPGFKTRLEQREEAPVRCRAVVADGVSPDATLPDAPYPLRRRPRNPILAPPPALNPAAPEPAAGGAQSPSEMIRRAVEALLGGADGARVRVADAAGEEGEVYIEVLDAEEADAEEYAADLEARLEETLRAAGFDIRGKKGDKDEDEDKRGRKAGRERAGVAHEEL